MWTGQYQENARNACERDEGGVRAADGCVRGAGGRQGPQGPRSPCRGETVIV